MKRYMLLAMLGTLALDTAGQQATRLRPDDPSAAVPAVDYRSPLEGYVRFRDEIPRPWRELNDEVGRTGGHAGILGQSGNAPSDRVQPSPSRVTATKPVDPTAREALKKPSATSSPKPAGHEHKGH